jgi:3-deoxy-D-manno-octulosonate 8-phosphate phosphatase (KDO 8-P phosphatase)
MAYMGDDIWDIPLLKAVGFSATVPEAVDEVKEMAQYTTLCRGGMGAVREVCDLILKYGNLIKRPQEKSS